MLFDGSVSFKINMKFRNVLSKLSKIEIYAVCGLFAFAFILLFFSSVFSTTFILTNNDHLENPTLCADNFFLNVLILLASLIIAYFLSTLLRKLDMKLLTAFVASFALVGGCIFVYCMKSAPTNDSYHVAAAAYYSAHNDYSYLTKEYFSYYPFQLGYVLFCEPIVKLFCANGKFTALQYANVICLSLTYIGICLISSDILKERAAKLTAILLMLSPQPILFCTFTYGNIPGFMFSVFSVYFLLRFLKHDKYRFGVLSALFVAFAITIKLNNSIVLVAEIIFTLFYFFNTRKELLRRASCIVLALLCTFTIKSIPKAVYESRSGIDFGDGIPMICWLNMGLNESPIANGWYNNEYTVKQFDQCGMDTEKTVESAKQALSERVSYFLSHPVYAVKFFAMKLITQFNEPTYQSIWTNKVRERYEAPVGIAKYICTNGEAATVGYMNYIQQLIFFGAAVAALVCFKRKDKEITLIMLIIFGGIMYHMLFEAKSQYFLTYYIILIPVCSYGLDAVYDKSKAIFKKEKLKWPKKTAAEN